MHRKTINTRIAKPFIWIIKGYQYTLSPDKGFPSFWLKGRVCMHTPHCSQYSVNAFKRYGFRPGIFYATDRVLHCTGGMNKIYDPDHYKIVFFSSAPIGVSFLQELNKDPRYEVGGVVTQCDKPSGRGMQMSESIIKQEAKKIKTSSSSNSFSFGEGELQRKIHEIWKNQHIYGEASIIQTKFARNMRKKPTLTEDILRNILRNRRFLNMKWRRQFPIHTYIADFYCHEYKTIIEVDGSIHETKEQKILDQKRNLTLLQLGYKILRFKNEEIIHNTEQTLMKIAKIVLPSQKERGSGGEENFIQTPTKLNPEKSDEGREFAERLKEKNADFFVVIGYGKIIPQAILDIPKIAPINIHVSLLPKYRGASPIQSTLLHEEKETGITVMKMDAGMDTGNIIDQIKFEILFNRTYIDVTKKMEDIGPKFFNDTLRKYGKKIIGETVQQENAASLCGKIEKESGLINPRSTPLHEIYAKYRGFYSRPKIYFILNGKRVIIEELSIEEKIYIENKDTPLLIGKQLNTSITQIILKPEGKKAMQRKDFLHGYLK